MSDSEEPSQKEQASPSIFQPLSLIHFSQKRPGGKSSARKAPIAVDSDSDEASSDRKSRGEDVEMSAEAAEAAGDESSDPVPMEDEQSASEDEPKAAPKPADPVSTRGWSLFML